MSHINTLQVYEDLVKSGVSAEQAKAHVYALDTSFDGAATKEDLESMKLATKKDFENFEIRFDSKLDKAIHGLKWFMVSTTLGTILIGFILPLIIAFSLKKLGLL